MATSKSDSGHETMVGQIGAAGDAVHFGAPAGLIDDGDIEAACGQLIEHPQLARRVGGAGETATVDVLT